MRPIRLILITYLMLWASLQPSFGQTITISGNIQIPLIEGSKILDPCDDFLIDKAILEPKHACVEFPRALSTQIQYGYGQALNKEGWIVCQGVGNAFFFTKDPANPEEILIMAGWIKDKPKDPDDWRSVTTVVFAFIESDKQALPIQECGPVTD